MGLAVGGDEVAEEERNTAVPGHGAIGPEVDSRERIGKTVLPAGELGVVVALVAGIPAEHHVAEAEAALDGGEELVAMDVLAAEDAVNVRYADLHLADVGAADRVEDLLVVG